MKYTDVTVSDSIKYIGVNDYDLDLFEGQYIIPNGVAYNSYVILDDKITIMDTVDRRACGEWLNNLKEILGEKTPDYLVVQHMEPDHAASINILADLYPDMKIVGNQKTFGMINQFFDLDLGDGRKVIVSEGDKLELGNHCLNFVMAPMVHWPEVMLSYESTEKILFSADAFGKFGTLDTDEEWDCEARRYYFNIVGNYISLYDTWSSYKAEDKGVFIAYASIYGNTKQAVEKLAEILTEKGVETVKITDLAREDWAEAIEDAFRYDRMVVASPTYDGGIFTPVLEFLQHINSKMYQNRKVGIIENGSWAPMAGKKIKEFLTGMKNIEIVEPTVTVKSAMKQNTIKELESLADSLL